MIFKIKKQQEKNNLQILFVRKLMKKLQNVEKMKKNVVTTRHLLNENIKLWLVQKKLKID
jgi:hypothetical protein